MGKILTQDSILSQVSQSVLQKKNGAYCDFIFCGYFKDVILLSVNSSWISRIGLNTNQKFTKVTKYKLIIGELVHGRIRRVC